MAEVISGDKLSRHNIDKYNFKVLAIGGGTKKTNLKAFGKDDTQEQQQNQQQPQQSTQPQQETKKEEPKSNKDSIIESLLKKTDEMSSNFIKLQMKLESMQEEHKQELEKTKNEAFEEGVLKGKEEATKECEAKYQESLNLFATSISKLESKANEYNTALETLKKELSSAAIDIAKEVVEIELKQNSNEIAEALSNSLIEELKDASKITLKVSPENFTYLTQKLSELKNVEVVADNAISDGGVVAISDVENIDAQIHNRLERVKKVILSE